MAKKIFKLSSGDKLSIFIASIALISAIFTSYIQFFHKTTEFRIGNVTLNQTSDSLTIQLNISVLLINTGTNPVAYNQWSTFLSADGSLPNGQCYTGSIDSSPHGFYFSNCSSISETIIEPNTVEFVKLKLEISKDDLAEYKKLNQDMISAGPNPFLDVGIRMSFIDSNGEIKSKEIIFGAVYHTNMGSGYKSYVHFIAKDLKIY